MPKNVQVGNDVIEFPDEMSDADIASALRKSNPPPTTNGAMIGAALNRENRVTNYLHDVGTDLSQGGSRTFVGRALGAMQGRQNGYSGLNSGVSQATGNFMGSPVLGVTHAAEGVAMTPQHPVAGPLKAVSGVLEAGTIPGLIVGGPAASTAIEAIPTRAHAGGVLEDIASNVGQAPVPLNEQSLAALKRLAEIQQNGGAGTVPQGVLQLIDRSQKSVPLIYPEARDFVRNISDLSTSSKLAANKTVLREVGGLAQGLHGDIAGAIGDLGPNYLEAIKEYARASAAREAAKRVGINALKVGAAGAGAYVIGRPAVNAIKGLAK